MALTHRRVPCAPTHCNRFRVMPSTLLPALSAVAEPLRSAGRPATVVGREAARSAVNPLVRSLQSVE